MDFSQVTQKDLDWFKALYPQDQALQRLTLTDYQEMAKGKSADLNLMPVDDATTSERLTLTPCELAVGVLAIDSILVLAGAFGIHGKINARAAAKAGEAMAKSVPKIAEIAKGLSKSSSAIDKAKAIWEIAWLVFSSGSIGAVVKAILKTLGPVDYVLYGVLFGATLTAAFLTDGAAIIALIVAEAAQLGFVVSDAVKVHQVC